VTGSTVALEPATPDMSLKRLPALAIVVLPYRFLDVSEHGEVANEILMKQRVFGGSVWESNPPVPARGRDADGFEVREGHRTPCASGSSL